jgi:hypothetical protein
MQCDDADLAAAAQELMRSLETVGATVRLWPQTLKFSIPAKRQIVSLAPMSGTSARGWSKASNG